ncbi:COG1361 S-layer family protein [Methanococcus maripaludis]|uniref:Uncharacterized protein n=1 Tax=Methanococcus maripaludis TaxID=39152 RepID=A0A2L1C8Q2_METMI|nr:hypothetical protein [Methanococcus maripaludis]AVB75761.1 hypothetical protein MMJJ_03440 [Methanococcus maripaludis]MBA2864177.1 hypothetical protein [Methanococcus maripaludis]MBB6497103.1 hypothetical protein [Methanococcus maripaludis]
MRLLAKSGLLLLVFALLTSSYALSVDDPQYVVDNSEFGETNPNVIHPGDDVNIWIKVVNDNYDKQLKDIKVEISPHYPFEIKQVNPETGVAEISHLNEGESDTAYFKIHVSENAPSDEYRIDVTVTATEYELGDEPNEREKTLTKIYYVPIYGIAKFEINLDDNNPINPSESEELEVYIKNQGTGTAKYLTLNLAGTSDLNIVGPTTFYLESLSPQTQKLITVDAYAIPTTEDGIYSINANIEWIGEDGAEYTSSIPINLKVKSTIFDNQPFLYLDGVKAISGGQEVTIALANRGTSKLKHCVLEIDGAVELNDNYIRYIGDLEEDDSDSGIYELEVFGDSKTNITATLTYFNEYHEEFTITQEFELDPANSQVKQEGTNYTFIGLIIVLAVVAYILYRRWKKRKDSEEE